MGNFVDFKADSIKMVSKIFELFKTIFGFFGAFFDQKLPKNLKIAFSSGFDPICEMKLVNLNFESLLF